MQQIVESNCLIIQDSFPDNRTNCLYFFMLITPFRKVILFCSLLMLFSSCAVKKGCPTNGANIGAERILSGDPKAIKAVNKGKKFKD